MSNQPGQDHTHSSLQNRPPQLEQHKQAAVHCNYQEFSVGSWSKWKTFRPCICWWISVLLPHSLADWQYRVIGTSEQSGLPGGTSCCPQVPQQPCHLRMAGHRSRAQRDGHRSPSCHSWLWDRGGEPMGRHGGHQQMCAKHRSQFRLQNQELRCGSVAWRLSPCVCWESSVARSHSWENKSSALCLFSIHSF